MYPPFVELSIMTTVETKVHHYLHDSVFLIISTWSWSEISVKRCSAEWLDLSQPQNSIIEIIITADWTMNDQQTTELKNKC